MEVYLKVMQDQLRTIVPTKTFVIPTNIEMV